MLAVELTVQCGHFGHIQVFNKINVIRIRHGVPHRIVIRILPYNIVPAKITILTLTKAARSGRPALLASWTAPSSETSILSYQIQYKSTSSSTWLTKTSTFTSTYLESLSAGSTYQVQVRANSMVGFGLFSALKTLQTYTGMILLE